jgi:membrane associated rhomboid family serine protease
MSYSGNYYRPSMFGGFSFFPPVIKGLMITNAAVFLLTEFLGAMKLDGVSLQYFIYRYFALLPFGDGFLPWQLVTYQFMHGGFWHLFFNMFFGLWMFGMEIEHMWGGKKFLVFYLMCGVVAGLVQLMLSPCLSPHLPILSRWVRFRSLVHPARSTECWLHSVCCFRTGTSFCTFLFR